MQYIEIFSSAKIENFIGKCLIFFLIFYYLKVGFKGVFIAQICFPDVFFFFFLFFFFFFESVWNLF